MRMKSKNPIKSAESSDEEHVRMIQHDARKTAWPHANRNVFVKDSARKIPCVQLNIQKAYNSGSSTSGGNTTWRRDNRNVVVKDACQKIPYKQLNIEKVCNSEPSTSGDQIRVRPTDRVLHRLSRFNKSTELMIEALPFQRLVCEVAEDLKIGVSFQAIAMAILHEAAEAYLVGMFEDAILYAVSKHIAIKP